MKTETKVYKSDKFDVEDTAGLSLFLYPNSAFVFAKDKNGANIAVHHHLNLGLEELEQLLSADQLLKQDVPCKVYFHKPVFALIPGLLFQPGQEAEYLIFAGEPSGKHHYFTCGLDSNNLILVSSITSQQQKALESRFPEVSFYHGACSFLSYLFKERFNLIGQEILIDYNGGQMYLAAFTDQELSLFNMFEIESPEDVLKYTLIAMDQLKFDKKHARVSVFGSPEENEITQEWGETYFHHFRMVKPHANQNYGHGFKHLKSENLFEANWQMD
ncbi:uncharacterized protein DUF3822 [Algoriphagus boseongensis]|uniref:Uncharacterized protein DUF3822 n=1 Tax=Algoriphagus boseongensis TaxID=1442587 RepID=A0A4R6TCR6_9BACT|nr:DUF3822 family protein [Algoriphagus boseongensis]TDQ19525.1 uncharacterized protein DUF3822 [Algoriphagus boseongensis]